MSGLFVRDQIDEARIHALERGGLRVRDVARTCSRSANACARIPGHRGGQSAEDTHDYLSSLRSGAAIRVAPTMGRDFGRIASRVPENNSAISMCYKKLRTCLADVLPVAGSA